MINAEYYCCPITFAANHLQNASLSERILTKPLNLISLIPSSGLNTTKLFDLNKFYHYNYLLIGKQII
jgi:hypothetical protein